MRPRLRRSASRLVVSALVSLAAASCSSDNPTGPTTTALQITCPAPKSAESLNGEPIAVDFGTPTTTGGSQPINVTCSPASGSTFPVGATTVTCTATDAKQATASCNLTVTVTRPGTLTATRFLAFGDSLTFGSPGGSCQVPSTAGMTFREFIERDARTFHSRADPPPPSAYPNVLRQLLASRYSSQSPVVVNSGVPGEVILDQGGTNDATLDRLRSELSRTGAQVLLLMEGVNDLRGFNHHVEEVPKVIKALGDFIREARARGAQVLLATLPPNDAAGCRGQHTWDMIVPNNDQLKGLAGNGVTIVDIFAAFGGEPGVFVGFDGLHATEAGYERMAQAFFATIRQSLEAPR